MRKKTARSKKNARTEDVPPPLGKARAGMNQLNRIVQRALEEGNFSNFEEANAYLREHVLDRPLDELLAQYEPTPEERSQDLLDEAQEAETIEEALELLSESLEIDPENLEALEMVAALHHDANDERVRALSDIVALGEEKLGSEFIEENKGHFWGILETRPYMRVRLDLLLLLLDLDRIEEATHHAEAMLELNPNDNQGVRDILLGLYLRKDNLRGARGLFDRYPESLFAVFNWSKVLERFLAGERDEALTALAHAHKQNRYVRDYLTARKTRPQDEPAYYSPGDRNEAEYCAWAIADAWNAHPHAVAWLRSL